MEGELEENTFRGFEGAMEMGELEVKGGDIWNEEAEEFLEESLLESLNNNRLLSSEVEGISMEVLGGDLKFPIED